MVIALIQQFSQESDSGGGIIIAAGIRTVIFAALVYVIMKMYRGKNWARIVLTVLLGVIGTLSLIIDPIQWLLNGNALKDMFDGMTVYSSLFGLSRVIHIAAVFAGLTMMFRPAANRYFRAG